MEYRHPGFSICLSGERHGLKDMTVRSGTPHCMGFMGSSNYCMAAPIDPPIRHYYSEYRPGAPLVTWSVTPWELLREQVPQCPDLCHESTDIFSPFEHFVARVRNHELDDEIQWIENHEPETLRACGFFHGPPARVFSVAWAMILRVRTAQRMHDRVCHFGDMSLLLQRFIDTHLRLCMLIYRFRLCTDDEVYMHPDYHRCSPLDLRGAYNGTLPNISHILMESNLFFEERTAQRTPIGQLVHFLCKQWPHPCVSRGYYNILKRMFTHNRSMMYLALDLVLVYGILGNYVVHWNASGMRTAPRRQPFFERAALLEHFLSTAWVGTAPVERLVRKFRHMFTFASRLFVMDLLERIPYLNAVLKRVYSLGDATREIDFVFAAFRTEMAKCNWRLLMRPGRFETQEWKRAEREQKKIQELMETMYAEMDRTHHTILIFLFKLRKNTFSGIMAHTLTRIVQSEEENMKRPLLPVSDLFDPETDPVFHPVLVRAIHHIAMHIAPRNDGYFPIEWFQLLGISPIGFEQLRDTYGAYEADTPDHPIHQRYIELFAADARAVLLMQRVFALVERFRGRRIVSTTWRTKCKQMASLITRFEMIDPKMARMFSKRLGLCYYCECGVWLSPVSDPKSNPRNIHALGLVRGGYNPSTGHIYCGRSRKPECAMPAKTINMVGKIMLMRGTWYALCTQRGCGILTKVDAERMGPDGPVCGMHPQEIPRIPQEAHPTRQMLANPAGNVFEARLKTQVPTHNRNQGLPCEYCGVRPLHQGGNFVFVYDPQSEMPFREVYLCQRHATAHANCLAGLQEKSVMFAMIDESIRKKMKI